MVEYVELQCFQNIPNFTLAVTVTTND